MSHVIFEFTEIVPILQGRVSLARIEHFLNEPETEKYAVKDGSSSAGNPIPGTIGFANASFSWSGKEDATGFKIAGLNFAFPVGELSIVVGPGECFCCSHQFSLFLAAKLTFPRSIVGSGKTTLLLSLLRETNLIDGESFLSSPFAGSFLDPTTNSDSVAYCSQTPWLLNATVRENILFGSLLDEKRYRDVVDACRLQRDFDLFPMGDRTEVGERGIVVSGGQKARICLARA